MELIWKKVTFFICTVKPVYKGHSREPDNVAFMSSCPLYRGYNYMHYSLMGENEIVLYIHWFVI